MRNFQSPGRSLVYATEGMCATSHPLATLTAIQTLQSGGNAMDAAIAGAVLLGLCEPQMTGIGGDCFVLYTRPGDPDVKALNGSGRAPRAASAASLRAEGHDVIPPYSPHAVTIPGAIDAFCHLSETEGKLGLDTLLAPAIHYAEAGIPIAPRVALDLAADTATLQGNAIARYSNAGAPFKTGDMFRSPDQAEVLRRIATQGRDAFYTGEVADDMLAALKAQGGVHTAEDFAQAAPSPTAPISGDYGGLEVVEHPPNGQGAAAILLLNILKHFDLADMDPLGAERAHIEAEATKLAYDARNRIIGDADHTARVAHLLAPETAASLAALISPDRVIAGPAAISESVHKETIYITVVDKDRMAVSLIYSIFHGFGSGIASDKFGILLRNRGAGFCLQEGHPNELQGGKRPMHTIIPGMLAEGGRVTVPFGVMGGQYQACGHARFVTNVTDFGMDLQTALDAPRLFPEAGELRLETGFSDATRQTLQDLGHNVVTPAEPIGGAQAIRIRSDGVLEGASDPRKDGCALGY
ncbi:MAG: gamma-glutamyltransferase family protein [Pseudomonadota bacterium]